MTKKKFPKIILMVPATSYTTQTVRMAYMIAANLKEEIVTAKHMLAALSNDAHCLDMLESLDVNIESFQEKAFKIAKIENLPDENEVIFEDQMLDTELDRQIKIAHEFARDQDRPTNTLHILLVMARYEKSLQSFFAKNNIHWRTMARAIHANPDEGIVDDISINSHKQFEQHDTPFEEMLQSNPRAPRLEKMPYIKDLTALARKKELPQNLIDDEIMSELQNTLLRKMKRNIMLLGAAGIGKSAHIESLAQMIADKKVPAALEKCRVLELDLARIVAGTSVRGQFEERLTQFISNVKPTDIVFIDEIHMIRGIGSSGDGAVDAAQILKQSLARNAFACIGATTYSEYKQKISKDEAFCRRFQNINLSPPDNDRVRQILKHVLGKAKPEKSIKISEESFDAIIDLSNREMPMRFQPDKAIDVMDHALGVARREGRRSIKPEDIKFSISKMTGSPMRSGIAPNLAEKLKDRIHGQDDICNKIAKKINRSLMGLNDPKTPMGRFLFTGPTGTGKTELATTLAKNLEMQLLKIDMSEYQEEHSVSKLIGAPFGYKGSDQGGLLTEAMKKQRKTVVVFDEIDKSHPKIRTLLLQILDDGILTDAQGHASDFRSSIIIMTANTGSRESGMVSMGFHSKEGGHEEAIKAVNKNFLPELRGRLDEIFVFNKASTEVLKKCASTTLMRMSDGLQNQMDCKIEINDDIITQLINMDFDKSSNGRSVQKHIEESVGDAILTWAENHSTERKRTLRMHIEGKNITAQAIPKTRRTIRHKKALCQVLEVAKTGS